MGCTSLAQLVFLSSSIPRICSRLLCTTQAWTHTCGTEPLTQSSHCVCELPEGDRTDLPSSALPSSWAAFVRGELLTNTTGGNSYGNTSKRRCYCIPVRLKEEKNEEGKKMFGHQCHVDIQSRASTHWRLHLTTSKRWVRLSDWGYCRPLTIATRFFPASYYSPFQFSLN